MIKYEDDELTRPLISTLEYDSREPKDGDGGEYLFRELGCDDELILRERDLQLIQDMLGLIEELKRFHSAGEGDT
jgi:hypothetical protein